MFATAGVHPYHVEEYLSLEDAMASIASLAAKEEGTSVRQEHVSSKRGYSIIG